MHGAGLDYGGYIVSCKTLHKYDCSHLFCWLVFKMRIHRRGVKAGALSKELGAELSHMSAEVSFVRCQAFLEVVRWPGGFWPLSHFQYRTV